MGQHWFRKTLAMKIFTVKCSLCQVTADGIIHLVLRNDPYRGVPICNGCLREVELIVQRNIASESYSSLYPMYDAFEEYSDSLSQ
jgi:hypothetical protein